MKKNRRDKALANNEISFFRCETIFYVEKDGHVDAYSFSHTNNVYTIRHLLHDGELIENQVMSWYKKTPPAIADELLSRILPETWSSKRFMAKLCRYATRSFTFIGKEAS